MGRRQFFICGGVLLAGAAFAARAQQSGKVWRIGFLALRSRSTPSNQERGYEAFVRAIRELGYVEGKNLSIEWRYADSQYDRLPTLAAELVKTKVDVIVTHGTPGTQAAVRATSTIPIVTAAVNDPISIGLVTSLARPGGNLTGLSLISVDLGPKHLELLRTLLPKMSRVAVLLNLGNSTHPPILKGVEAAARQLGVKVLALDARNPEQIERGFAVISKEGAEALIAGSDSFLIGQRSLIAAQALKYRIPSVFTVREHVDAGGLMSYGQNLPDYFRRSAGYVDKILKGASAGSLPIEQPTNLELVLNAKTARSLGLRFPQELMFRADEVIE